MQEWDLIKEEKVYDGYRKIHLRTFRQPDGTVQEFEVIKTDGGVAVLAITDDQKIVCYRTFRPGPQEVLFELPGGGIENPDKLSMEVQRELLEETGYSAEVEFIGSYCRDAYVTSRWQMFVGRHAKRISKQKLDQEEHGDVVLLTVDEFKRQLFAGNMTDTTLGYAGLHELGLL